MIEHSELSLASQRRPSIEWTTTVASSLPTFVLEQDTKPVKLTAVDSLMRFGHEECSIILKWASR
jgi:hypothetical protein